MTVQEIKDEPVYFIESEVENFNPLAPPLIMCSGVPRSPGLHLSQILGDIYDRVYRKKGASDDEFEGRERMALGFAWEHILSWAIGNVFPSDRILLHPGEFEVDGIAMSPDGIDVVDDCGEEWKCTYKTARKRPPDDYPLWMMQFKSYCNAIGVNKTRLRILHVNGAYNKDGSGKRCQSGPCILTFLLEFTARELKENWLYVLSHRDQMRREGKL